MGCDEDGLCERCEVVSCETEDRPVLCNKSHSVAVGADMQWAEAERREGWDGNGVNSVDGGVAEEVGLFSGEGPQGVQR